MSKKLKRNIFQRILGISATKQPRNNDCWKYSNNKLTVTLKHSPELSEADGAIRLEGNSLPYRVLIIHGVDDKYYAFRNKCGHAGRRLDPDPESETIQCCSIGKSTYNYDGNIINGPTKEPVTILAVKVQNDKIVITVE